MVNIMLMVRNKKWFTINEIILGKEQNFATTLKTKFRLQKMQQNLLISVCTTVRYYVNYMIQTISII